MTPSADELRAAIAAVQAAHPGAHVPSDAESWVSDEPGRRIVYVNATRREGLSAGTPYGTWIVVFAGGSVVEVARFDSLACALPSSSD